MTLYNPKKVEMAFMNLLWFNIISELLKFIILLFV